MRIATKAAMIAVSALTIGLMPAVEQTWAQDNGSNARRSLRQTAARGATQSVARIWNEELLDAIRIDTPRPGVHARNLFHLSVCMYDAWCAYQDEADHYLVEEDGGSPADIEAARAEAISFAAYRLLKHRFQIGPGSETTQSALDDRMDNLGYDKTNETLLGTTPPAIGNRIAAAVISHGLADGSNEVEDYVDDTGYEPINDPMSFGLPGVDMEDPNRWQPLAFDYLVLQNGIVIGFAIQEFIGPHWGQVTPFALNEDHLDFPWVYLDPGLPPQVGGPGDAAFKSNAVEMIEKSAALDPFDSFVMDIGPATNHNNPIGTQDGTGYGMNPITGEPYGLVPAIAADYRRCLAEFWADGPHSETPPGHWNVIANINVADNPDFEKRIGGTGPIVNDLEWDVKTYLAMNGATHDAAVAAWGCKGYYDYSRPISHVRWLCQNGQSSDLDGPSYHPDGIPLVADLIEVITDETAAEGGRHHHLIDQQMTDSDGVPLFDPLGNPMLYGEVGDIAIRSWTGTPEDTENEVGGVGWILGIDWIPYQLSTFVTPAFAGYVSGHSTFSRAGAEVLTGITGSDYFPGGVASYTLDTDFLKFEDGPMFPVQLTWARYYDAADEAGISRLWGGIHPQVDDFPARILGSSVGKLSWQHARRYFEGRISCPTDLDGDGTTGLGDLLEVIGFWGADCGEDCWLGCPGDINGDCTVDISDLLDVIGTWGTCGS